MRVGSLHHLLGKDVIAGLLFLTLGLAGVVLAQALPAGDSIRMGPGYLPRALSWLLALLGLVIMTRGVLSGDTASIGWRLRPLFGVVSAVALFGLAIDRGGLIAAIVLTVLISAIASPDSRRLETVLLAAALAAFSAMLFVKLLGLPIGLWPRLA